TCALPISHHPNIGCLHIEDFGKLGGNNGKKLIHLKGRVQNLFDVVELCQPGNRLKAPITLVLVAKAGSDGDRGRVGQFHHRHQAFLVKGGFKGNHLDSAYYHLVGDQGNVSQGEDGAADVEVSVVLACKGGGFARK